MADGVYQVRGYDLSNMTLIRGASGGANGVQGSSSVSGASGVYGQNSNAGGYGTFGSAQTKLSA